MNHNNQQPGSAELLPCPFCGGAAEYEEDYDANYSNRVACQECPATVDVKKDDFSRWNRRAPSPQVAEELPSIDTPEFREALYAWHIATDGERAGEKGAALIAHIDKHTRDAIAASRRADCGAMPSGGYCFPECSPTYQAMQAASLPDMAMPEPTKLRDALEYMVARFRVGEAHHTYSQQMALKQASEALAAQPAEGSAQVAKAPGNCQYCGERKGPPPSWCPGHERPGEGAAPAAVVRAPAAQAIALAAVEDVRSDYFVKAIEGKLNSIRRNRNMWKVDAAAECAERIKAAFASAAKPAETMTGRVCSSTPGMGKVELLLDGDVPEWLDPGHPVRISSGIAAEGADTLRDFAGEVYTAMRAFDGTWGKSSNEMRRATLEAKAAKLMRGVAAEGATPAGEWISVENGLPEDRQVVAFVVDAQDWERFKYLHGRVLGGQYSESDGHFSVPGVSFIASHWMPLPPRPRIDGDKHGEQGGGNA